MLPVRVALNVGYAVLVTGLDSEQRQDLDERLYDWNEQNQAADRRLRAEMMGGGED